MGKVLVKDACLEKFNQCLIINGYLIAKVVPDDNELVLNNNGLLPNNIGQVPNNDELDVTLVYRFNEYNRRSYNL